MVIENMVISKLPDWTAGVSPRMKEARAVSPAGPQKGWGAWLCASCLGNEAASLERGYIAFGFICVLFQNKNCSCRHLKIKSLKLPTLSVGIR